MNYKILEVIVPVADYAAKHGLLPVGDEILTAAIKTEAFYNKTLRRLVKTFYNGQITELDFIGIFANLITGQTLRAYHEGLRSVGYNLNKMTGAMYAEIDQINYSEQNYVLDFIQEVLDAKEAGTGFEQFYPRVDTWTNRYIDVVNRGVLAGAKLMGILLEWKVGETDHCDTCRLLNGTVAHPYQWELSEYFPQRPPNSKLECGGWNCLCTLVKTDKPATIAPDGVLTL